MSNARTIALTVLVALALLAVAIWLFAGDVWEELGSSVSL
jgi:hypothetical protein